MWLKSFFKPLIESDDPKKRLLALKKINDSKLLLEIVLKDSSKEVSLKASQLLHDKEDLLKVLHDSKHLNVRTEMVRRLGKGYDSHYLDLLKGSLPMTLKKQILFHIEDTQIVHEAEKMMKESQYAELKKKLSSGEKVDEKLLRAYLSDSRLEEKDLEFLRRFKEKWSNELFKLGKLLIDSIRVEKDIDLVLSSLNPAYKAHNSLFRLGLEKLNEPLLLGKHSRLYLCVMGNQDNKTVESLTEKLREYHLDELKVFFDPNGHREDILFKEDIFIRLITNCSSKAIKTLIECELPEEYKGFLISSLEKDGKIKEKDCLLWIKREGGENYLLREKAWQYLGVKGILENKLQSVFKEFVQENYGRSVSFATHFDTIIDELSFVVKKNRDFSQRKCSYCNGDGFIYENTDMGLGKIKCFHCSGKGYLGNEEAYYTLERRK